MIKPKDYKIQECAIPNKSAPTLKKDQYIKFTSDLGRFMRSFLNSSVELMFAFSLLTIFVSQLMSPRSVIIILIPLVTTIIFLFALFRQLKRLEQYAGKKRNIEPVSRIIEEFNQSHLMRSVMGKVRAFIEEE
jgi:c-di-AMP phosphodiesterase-like protein